MKKIFVLLCAAVLFYSSQAEPAQAHPRSIVVFDGFWLGSVADGKWKSAEDFRADMAAPERQGWVWAQWEAEYPFPYPRGGERYAIYLSTGYHCAAQGEGLHGDHRGEFGDELDKIEMHAGDEGKDAALKKTAYLGLSGINFDEDGEQDKNRTFPREAAALSAKNAAYEKIMKEYLARNGLSDTIVNIMQLFRVDLEGDGVDEAVIYAQNVVDPQKYFEFLKQDKPMEEIKREIKTSAEPGMYSVLLLRKIVNGKVREIPLVSFIAQKGTAPGDGSIPTVQRVYRFADLNGDGTLEIIFGSAHGEGFDYNAIEVLRDGSVETVLSNAEVMKTQ